MQPGSEVVTTRRGPVEYVRLGPAFPVVVGVHGSPGGYDQIPALFPGFPSPAFGFLSWSRPGYLRTPLAIGPSFEQQADLLIALLDALGIGRVALFAFSGGGPTAVHFAARYPQRTWALILESAVTQPRPWGRSRFLRTRAGNWLLNVAADVRPHEVFGALLRTETGLDAEMARDVIARALHDPARAAMLHGWLRSASPAGSRRHGLANDAARIAALGALPLETVSAPTLILHGRGDADVPVQDAERAARLIRGAELVRVPDCLHLLPLADNGPRARGHARSLPAPPRASLQRSRVRMNRSGWLPVGLVSVAMLYAVLVPTLLRRTPDRLRSEIGGMIEPARHLARTRQANLAFDVSAYRAYVISHDARLLERAREARARAEGLGAQLSALARKVDPETAQAVAAFDQKIREWHGVAARRADIDLQVYRDRLSSLQDQFEATQKAADHLDELLARKADERARAAGSLILYQDLGNVALSLLAVAAVVTVSRLARREQRARAGAEAAVRSRDQVVSIVSHDLRNPLSNVGMAASLVREYLPAGDEGVAARRQLDIIKRNCDRMNRMIQDLLDVARIESGRLAVERAPVAVEPLMDEVAAMLRPGVERRGQRLDRRVAAGLPAVSADRDRLLQVFSNLIDNAVKFTPAGGTITVTAEADPRGVRFGVSDTGSGLAPELVHPPV